MLLSANQCAKFLLLFNLNCTDHVNHVKFHVKFKKEGAK